MRDLNELGLRPLRRNRYGPPTAAEVHIFEHHFKVMLPEAYVQLLQFSNGGRPLLSTFDDPNGGICGIDNFYGLGPKEADDKAASKGTWDPGNLWGETRWWMTRLGGQAIPFGSDGGDNQIFMDLTRTNGPICRFVSATGQRYEIAGSFADFVNMLRRPPWAIS